MQEAITFIQESLAKKAGSVLVHCEQGKSRSPSFMISYLMTNGKGNDKEVLNDDKENVGNTA